MSCDLGVGGGGGGRLHQTKKELIRVRNKGQDIQETSSLSKESMQTCLRWSLRAQPVLKPRR